MKTSDHTSLGKIFGAPTFASLREHHNYRLYFSGQFLSLIGTWLQSAAMAWLVLELTHSAFAVGMLAFWQFGPYLVLGLFGGVLSDRLDHRTTLIVTQVALALCSGVMALLTFTHVITVWEAYVIAAIRGIVLVMNNPSRQAFIFQMVGRKELPNAIALNSSVANATRIIGPGIGGILIAAFGVGICFTIDAISYVLCALAVMVAREGVGICFTIDAISYVAVIIALLMMHVDELLPIEGHGKPKILRGIAEGLSYTFRNMTVWLALTIFLFICIASINFTVLLPLVASNTLHAGADVFGLLTACFGAGALIGALISASLGRATWPILLTSAAGFGIGELLFAPQHTIVGAVILLIITGIFYTLYTSNTNAIIQLATPGYLQGRVAGLYSYIFSGSNAIGALLVGALADAGGTQLAFIVGGGTAVVCAAFGLIVRLYESHKKTEDNDASNLPTAV